MQLLEWLVIILVYFAAYGLWSTFEARRERAPYRPEKARLRRRAVRLSVLTLGLLGLGLAYNSPTVQTLFSAPPLTYPETEPQDETRLLPPLTEYTQGDAHLVVAPPPLLGATRQGPKETVTRKVSVAALPSPARGADLGAAASASPVATPPIATPPAKRLVERAPAQPPQRAERLAPSPKPSPRPALISPHPAKPQVRLSFQSDPAGATLYVDGARVGVTPTELSVEAGKRLHYTLRAESNLPNHELYYPHLDMLEPTQNASLSVWLERLNHEEVAALQAGNTRGLPAFDSFD